MSVARLVNGCEEPLTIEGPSPRVVEPGATFEVDVRTAAILLRAFPGVTRVPDASPDQGDAGVPTLILPAGARTAGRAG